MKQQIHWREAIGSFGNIFPIAWLLEFLAGDTMQLNLTMARDCPAEVARQPLRSIYFLGCGLLLVITVFLFDGIFRTPVSNDRLHCVNASTDYGTTQSTKEPGSADTSKEHQQTSSTVIPESTRSVADREYDSSRKWRITACAMIRNELPYLFEWIEFHRLQGVDHFVLYDDESADDVYLLPLLYASRGFPDFVEVHPANFRRGNRISNHGSTDHLNSQRAAMQHCNQRLLNKTHYIMAVDMDEYMFSTQHATVWDFLLSQKHLTHPVPHSNGFTSNFYTPSIRFGTGGQKVDFKGRIDADWKTGRVTAHLDLINGSAPMLTAVNPSRAPHPDLDEDFEDLFREICKSREDKGAACTHANGKSIWIPERCFLGGIHWCEKHSGISTWTSIKDLRVNHYALRSTEHVQNMSPWLKPWKAKLLGHLDVNWFSSKRDDSIQKYLPLLRLNLEKLSSSDF